MHGRRAVDAYPPPVSDRVARPRPHGHAPRHAPVAAHVADRLRLAMVELEVPGASRPLSSACLTHSGEPGISTHTRSRSVPMNPRFDLVGRRFGRLVVVSFIETRGTTGRWWKCVCDCGNEFEARTGGLLSGVPASCGCGQRDAAAKACLDRSTHGQRNTRLYVIWRAMRSRCSNPKVINWLLYGGRGISVCAEWLSFPVFSQWALSNGYADRLSIDRINCDGNYEPANCRWATPTEQALNRRTPARRKS